MTQKSEKFVVEVFGPECRKGSLKTADFTVKTHRHKSCQIVVATSAPVGKQTKLFGISSSLHDGVSVKTLRVLFRSSHLLEGTRVDSAVRALVAGDTSELESVVAEIVRF